MLVRMVCMTNADLQQLSPTICQLWLLSKSGCNDLGGRIYIWLYYIFSLIGVTQNTVYVLGLLLNGAQALLHFRRVFSLFC